MVDSESSLAFPWVPALHKVYLKSHTWRKRKRDFFKTHEKNCAVCGGKKNIHLHHKTYERLWVEKDEDLLPLCGSHHNELHQVQFDYNLSVESATRVYLHWKVGRICTMVISDTDIIEWEAVQDLRIREEKYA